MARAEPQTDLPSLYEEDFARWLDRQAALLRAGRVDQLDRAHLLEEIEDMGRSERRAVRSNLTVVLLHLLKHQFQPENRTSGWRASIVEHRQRLRHDFEQSPSLRPHAAAVFESAYADARERAHAETGLDLEAFPETCPYAFEQVLDSAFLPD